MNVGGHDINDTCRTCLARFEEAGERYSMFQCSVVTSGDRLQLLKNILTACSLTLNSSYQEEELLVCSKCIGDLDKMLSFLEQCIHANGIFKELLILKEEKNPGTWTENSERLRESSLLLKNEEIEIKAELEECEDGAFLGFDPDDVPLSSYSDLPLNNSNESLQHECQECHKTFRSALSLINHRYKHTGNLPHSCTMCDESFKSLHRIKKHMLIKHDGARYKPYICRQCSDLFPSRYHLTRHEQSRHNSKVYPCNICKKAFASFSSLKFHQNVHLGVRPYSCSFCSKTFTSARILRDHKQNIHSDTKKFHCHCGRSFNRKKKLEFHVDAVHEKKDELRKYHCTDCDKKFHHPYSLKNHLNTHLGVKPYLCNVCGSAFTSPSNLRSHFRRIHSAEKKRPEKTYLCHNCGESFARAAHLKRHNLRKHIPNAEKKYECPICKKRFLEKSDVTGHVKLHDDLKPFVCSQCTKCFRTSWRLQAHVNRVHLGLRPFECPTCSVKFKTKSHLEKHIRTHTGEKPFPCPHCAYTCAEKSNLKKHINIHLKAR